MPLLVRLDILSAYHVALQIHNIRHRNIGEQVHHPQDVVHGSNIGRVTVVLKHTVRWKQPAVLLQFGIRERVAAAHVCEAGAEVSLLPYPPEPVQVGMVEEEERVAWASALEFQLGRGVSAVP